MLWETIDMWTRIINIGTETATVSKGVVTYVPTKVLSEWRREGVREPAVWKQGGGAFQIEGRASAKILKQKTMYSKSKDARAAAVWNQRGYQ